MLARQPFRRAALPLLGALAANAAAQSFLLVVLPPLGRRLGFSDIQTGALLGLSALMLLLSAPAWGFASERLGRKPVIAIALAAAALGPLCIAGIIWLRLQDSLAILPALGLLFAARLLQSALGGGLLPAAQAWMADRTGTENRAEGMGLLGASYGIGAIIGAGLAFAAGGTAPVAALTLLGMAIAAGLAWVVVQLDGSVVHHDAADETTRLQVKSLLPALVITFLAITVHGIMQQVTALRLQDDFGMDTQTSIARAGATLMGAAFAMAVVQAMALRMLRLPPQTLRLGGAVLALAAMALATLASGWTMLAAGLVLFGAALGLLLPGNLASLSLLAGKAAQGRAAGINAVAQGLGMAAGPMLGAILHRTSTNAPYLASMLLLAMICVVPLFRSHRQEAIT